jgi:hypothetical protein
MRHFIHSRDGINLFRSHEAKMKIKAGVVSLHCGTFYQIDITPAIGLIYRKNEYIEIYIGWLFWSAFICFGRE